MALSRHRTPVALVAVATVVASVLIGAAAPARAAACQAVFPASFVSSLQARHPGVRITAAVYDTRDGCWYHINPGRQITTASVMKAQVMGLAVLRAQQQGRGLTQWEHERIRLMIRFSDNPSTSALYGHVGGAPALEASDPLFGAGATTHTPVFGLTRSTAIDRTQVALRLLHAGGPLAPAGRALAWSYMADVHPLQQWGISAGVPHDWSVALKNGFYPASGLGWRVGSSGFVRDDRAGQGYAITVMTEGAASQARGIQVVEEVSRRAAASLTVGAPAERPVDRARCMQTSSGETWGQVTQRLGLPATSAATVRLTAGNNDRPLGGQRACSPEIPAEPRQAGSTVNGRYDPVVTDLDCDGRDDIIWFARGAPADYIWRGRADRRFDEHLMPITETGIPLPGDFDGDGCGDVLWYGPGPGPDSVWYGGATIDRRAVTVAGAGFAPMTGDFDADGRDDVFWYAPGSSADLVWHGRAERGRFTPRSVVATRSFQPVVGDLDGDGADDIVWYGPGARPDAAWRGRPGVRSFQPLSPRAVAGRYRTVAGDFDRDGADEIVWHVAGPTADALWNGIPPTPGSRQVVVAGEFLARSGDFDGDGADDVVWYGVAGLRDAVWWGRAGASGFTPGLLQRS